MIPRGAVPAGVVTAAIRSAAPRALAVLTRRTGDFDDAEDAVQEALLAAAQRWPALGLPDDPVAWLVRVAERRWIDAVRSESARRRREAADAAMAPTGPADPDDPLTLLLLCCHPVVARPSRVALTLRAVGGLTTREIARGLLVPEATVAQRISRAKAALRRVRQPFAAPPEEEIAIRVGTALDVIGLIHTESHSATEGDVIARPVLALEALRLARGVVAASRRGAGWRGEAVGLTALVLLTESRAPSRHDSDGALIPLAEQDRTRWRSDLIAEATAMLADVLSTEPLGPFQLRAAIAAVHAEAATAEATDWPQILALYDLLRVLDPGPVVELARVVALAAVRGPATGLAALDAVRDAAPLRVAAVRAHLLVAAGRADDARRQYAVAAALARNGAERRWFAHRAG